MKRKLLLIFILILGIVIFNKYDIKAQNEDDISIYFTNTNYELLNKEISKNLEIYINDFKNEITDINKTYTLNIRHDTYEYQNYISYVFYMEYYVGGAHPNHKIWTINYDKVNNKIINIDDLEEKYPNILNILSKISREKLLHTKNIVDTNMMLEGSKPIKENFANFAFSKDGLILFFNYYQVAPYSSGEFKIVIPYDEIKNIL